MSILLKLSPFVFGLFLSLYTLSALLLPMASITETASTPIVIGHRGAAGLAPENTLAGIQKSLDLKVDRIEIDVQQTKDSIVILMHDKTLERTTDGKGLVKDHTFVELQQYSAGVKFNESFKAEKIPTLETALKLIHAQTEFIIEIKSGNEFYPKIVDRVVDLIHQYDAKQWCIIHSFNDKVLKRVQELDSSIRTHKVLVGKIAFLPLYLDFGLKFGSLKKYKHVEEISINYRFANKRIIKKIHSYGKKVNVWTVNDPAMMEKLKSWGVDGIITDYPNYLLKTQ